MPPYSPDINIIELVWADLKRYIRKKLCETEEQLVYRIHKYFKYKLTVKKCRNFINHLTKVLKFIELLILKVFE
jgi:transposase